MKGEEIKEMIVPVMAFLAFVISIVLLWVNWSDVKAKVEK